MKRKQILLILVIVICFCSIAVSGIAFFTQGEETPSTGAGDASDDASDDASGDASDDASGDAAGADASSSKYRYVKIWRDKDGDDHWMNLAEVEVFSGGVNVAEGKTVTQSSIYNDTSFPPKFLVDGDKNNFAHTNNDELEWFLIDLGKKYEIEKVVITNRQSCCQNRLRNTKIQLSKTEVRGFVNFEIVKESRAITVDESANTAVTWDVKTNKVSVSGIKLHRYVKIWRDKDGDDHWMNIAEVGVFSGGINIAKGKTVTQSSIYHDNLPPTFLVDEIKTNFAHTHNNQVEWFLIDLGGNYEIEKVVITNRQSCCKGRLRNTKIQLSTVMHDNELLNYMESRAITANEATKAEVTWNVKTNEMSSK